MYAATTLPLVTGCRKWTTAYSFQPRLLDSVTSATVEQLTNRCKVLWVPTADVASQLFMRVCTSGKWVAPSEACLVQPSDYAASAVVVNVARRAGLHIPDVPSHVFQASRQPIPVYLHNWLLKTHYSNTDDYAALMVAAWFCPVMAAT